MTPPPVNPLAKTCLTCNASATSPKTCDGPPGAHGPMTSFAPLSYTHPAPQDGKYLRRHPGFGQAVSRAFALPTKG